jgi:hypothetical protein
MRSIAREDVPFAIDDGGVELRVRDEEGLSVEGRLRTHTREGRQDLVAGEAF